MLSLDFLIAEDGFNYSGSLLQANVMREIPPVSPNNSGILCLRMEYEAFVKVVQYFLLSCLLFLLFDVGVAKRGCFGKQRMIARMS
jgi:hypothetical protein